MGSVGVSCGEDASGTEVGHREITEALSVQPSTNK